MSEKDDPEGDRYNNPFAKLVLILLAAGVLWGIYHLYSGDPASPTVINEDGEEVLSPERQGKLDRELEEIDHAVQYVLIASSDGYYPCYTCPDSLTTIFLSKFEVWRYGATRRGEARRYPNGNYRAPNLLYVEEFTGTYSECLKREKIQIYKYPLLPQARQRKIILFRSPGNKNDG